jgi:hypothetical protein
MNNAHIIGLFHPKFLSLNGTQFPLSPTISATPANEQLRNPILHEAKAANAPYSSMNAYVANRK